MDTREFFERYAAVVAAVGLSIQPDQEVYVRAPIEASDFVPHFVRAAYRRGARYVHVDYRQQAATRARLEEAPADSLSYVPPGATTERLRIARDGGASLAVLGEDPTGLSGIDADRKAVAMKALAEASHEIRELAMKDFFPWCVISIPNPVWARTVYPDLPEDEALAKLFDAVAHACRLDTPDPVAAWRDHSDRLMKIADWLTLEAFDRFHYEAPGTDLTVGMPANQHWIATEGYSANGITFIANLPTDEVFSAPDWRRVEGTVRSTRPLVLDGTDVGIAEFVVREGRIVDAKCEREQEVLDAELDLDEYARLFGEIALVPEDAPIAELGTTFFDGLYDENAGCHLAFGNAYANCVAGGDRFEPEARREAGLNVSEQHTDFTVGSDRLTLTAYRKDGSEMVVMREGRWTPEMQAAAGV
ncbi:MAG: aminopeptidase [Spirochaetota bacterium]